MKYRTKSSDKLIIQLFGVSTTTSDNSYFFSYLLTFIKYKLLGPIDESI